MRENFSNLDRSLIGPQLLKQAEVMSSDLREQYSPNMRPFIEHYGKETVLRDLQKVAELEKTFTRQQAADGTQEQKRLATVFENFFIDAANTEQWFGNAEVMRSTRYDDYVNGVDVLTTLYDDEDRASHLEMSADLTFGTNASNTKLEKILHDIESGRLAKVKYFHSDHMGFTGALKDVPRTVIGLDKHNLPEFIRQRVHGDVSDTDHRDILLTQQQMQLRFFRDYADKRYGEHPIRRKYANASRIIDATVAEKNIDYNNLPTDEITNNILEMSHR